MSRPWFIQVLLLSSLIGVAGGCKSNKSIAVETPPPAATIDYRLERWEAAMRNDLNVAELSISGDLTATLQGNEQSSAFNFRIQKGRQIWMVLRPALGIEAFRILITPDSVRMLDRLNRVYYEKPVAYLQQLAGTPIDYFTLEGLLLNNIGHHTEVQVRPRAELPNSYELQSAGLFCRYELQPDSAKTKNVELTAGPRKLKVAYEEMSRIDGNWVPALIKAVLNNDEKTAIVLKFSKFAVENGQSYPYSIPKNYSPAP